MIEQTPWLMTLLSWLIERRSWSMTLLLGLILLLQLIPLHFP
ncbi:hypothetical protein [Oceanobacillus kapialis]